MVVFISAEYLDRDWTRLERRAAFGRAVRERREYVLPARFDDTPLPGLLSDMVSVDLRRYTPGQFAEMVAAKLAGLDITAPPPPAAPVPLAGPVDLVLAVTGERVRLSGGGADASAGHGGVRPGLAEAVNEARRARGRAGLPVRDLAGAPVGGGELPLGRAGRLLAESFLPGPVAAALETVLAGAERAHQLVRVGLEVPGELAGLPWEALPAPDGRGPLALHPLVSVYRKTERGAGAAAAGAAADRGGDRRPRHRRRGGAGLRAGAAERAGRGPGGAAGRGGCAGGAVRHHRGDPGGAGPRPGARAAPDRARLPRHPGPGG